MERGLHIGLRQYLPAEGPRLPAPSEGEFAREAVGFAIEHLSERQAAFGRRDALVQALRAGRGAATSQAITAELDRRISAGDLVQDTAGQWLTTRTAIEAEQRLLTIEREGRDAVPAIGMAVPRAAEAPAFSSLNAGQRSLVELILTTRNRIIGVNGLAGTGKTTALAVARNLAEREDFEFVGLLRRTALCVRCINPASNRRPCSAGFWIEMRNRG